MKWIVAGAVMSALVGSTALAVPIAAEYFDYGPTTLNLPGLGSTVDGWTGSWSNAGDLAMPDYGNTNLDLDAKYPAAQYNNSANVGGMAGKFSQVSPWYATYRDFATPQTGTIWLSAILRYAVDDSVSWDHAMLYLKQEESGLGLDGVGIHDGHAFMVYRSWTDYDATGPQAYVGTDKYLLLVKVEMNYSSTLDRVTMWIDPNLSSGEAGLGGGTLMKDGQNALGSSLLGVGVSVGDQTNQGLDAIRVGTTLADVTSVPEPASLAMLILGGVPMVMRRRRA